MPWPDEPDTEEKIIRVVCGALFGAVMGLLISFRRFPTQEGLIVGTLAGAVVCAVFALTFGNRFWYSLRNWWWL